MPDWVFDPSVGTYRDPKGHPRTYATVRKAYDKRIAEAKTSMQGHGSAYGSGDLTLAQFEAAMRADIKRLHVQGRILGAGGKAATTKSDYGKVGAAIKKEYKYLRGFVQDIEDERHTEAGIINRAGQYAGSNAIRQFEAARLAVMDKAGYSEMRYAGPDDGATCATCSERLSRGWVPLDEPDFEIGDSECKSGCRHTIEYRKGGE